MKIIQTTVSFWIGIVLLATASIFVFASLYIPWGSAQKPGPGLMPFVFAIILAVCSVGILLEAKRADAEPMPKGDAAKTVIAIVIMILLYPLALKFLGFLISTGALVGASAYALKMPKTRAIWLAIVSVALSYGLFALLLGVPLPTGFLGF